MNEMKWIKGGWFFGYVVRLSFPPDFCRKIFHFIIHHWKLLDNIRVFPLSIYHTNAWEIGNAFSPLRPQYFYWKSVKLFAEGFFLLITCGKHCIRHDRKIIGKFALFSPQFNRNRYYFYTLLKYFNVYWCWNLKLLLFVSTMWMLAVNTLNMPNGNMEMIYIWFWITLGKTFLQLMRVMSWTFNWGFPIAQIWNNQ